MEILKVNQERKGKTFIKYREMTLRHKWLRNEVKKFVPKEN